MGSWFGDILIAVLSGYLALTNSLANTVSNWLPETENKTLATTAAIDQSTTPSDSYETLHTNYETGGAIPDILIENAAWQQATVVEAVASTTVASDPADALVNIYCQYQIGNALHGRTGSGFFIHEGGVIITNAHVAQFLLLDDLPDGGTSECTVRTGSPATAQYTAELLYISPAWILEHANLIDDPNPSGTGERDYALLYINDSSTATPLPARFPTLSFAVEPLARSVTDTTVTVLGYPAHATATKDSLTLQKATTSVGEMFTFGSNLADVFALRGSSVGARGSSGGPVIDAAGNVIAMVSTRGNDTVDGAGSLRAITMSHVDRTIQAETSFNLPDLMTGNLAYRAAIFNQTLVPFLSETLGHNLE